MIKFILKLLLPGYFEYQEEFEKQLKSLERECVKNER